MTTKPKYVATDLDGPTGRLSAWLAGLTLDDVPATAKERAKDIILDGLGCALVGARLPWSEIAVEAVCGFEGEGPSPIIGWDRTIAAPASALLNGTFIQGFELDDFHPGAPLHSASLVLPGLLAQAAREPMTGSDFLLGAVAGFETGPRVGLALHGPEMLSRGWHSGPVFGTHAVAAALGKVMGFDSGTFEDAFGLAGTQSSGLMAAQYEAMCKRMQHGMASRNGVYAALLAAKGYTGIKRVFEREYGGFLSVFGEGHDPDASLITEALGERWEVERIVLKPYAAMGALHGPLDGIFAIAKRRPLNPEEIDEIEIGMSDVGYHHGWWEAERPLTPIGAQMHVGYAVTAAILDGAAMIAQFAPDRIDRDDIWKLLPKVRAHHDAALDATRESRNGCTVSVRFRDGSQEFESVMRPRTFGRPLDRGEVIEKFETLCAGVIEADRRNAIRDAVLAIEDEVDMTGLVSLLTPAVTSPFDHGRYSR